MKNFIYKILIISTLSAITFGLHSCKEEPKIPPPPTEKPGTTFEHEGNLSFLNASDSSITDIEIEIAETEESITQGLMYRKSMPLNRGMLFIFPDNRPRSFWMKNTIIPLDIIYVDDQNTIVSIKAHTTPFSEASIPSDNRSAKYVIEVNAGFTAKYGIKIGDKMSFERI